MKTTSMVLAAAGLAVLLSSSTLRAQVPAPSPAAPPETAPAASPAPVPTPLPVLMGPAYDTLGQLAAALRTEVGHALEGTQAAAALGRPTRLFMPGIRMFARRTEWFEKAVAGYRAQPFDIAGTVNMMNARANMLSRRVRNTPALQHTWEDWDLAVDVLDRIRKLLAGEKVAVPPPHTPRPVPAATPTPAPAATPAPTPSPTPR